MNALLQWKLRHLLMVLLTCLPFWEARGQLPGKKQVWQGFFDQKSLQRTLQVTIPGIEENFNEVIWPRLTAAERKKLAGVRLNFHLEEGSHILNFYADGKTVVMPVSAVRFLSEISMVNAYLNRKKHNTQLITDYLSILKYQWPDKLRHEKYRPLEAFGISPQGQHPADVVSMYNKTFSYAILFALCHELGHIYYQHPGYNQVSPARAQANESQADQFSLEILGRTGDPVHGGVAFFFWISEFLLPNSTDPEFVHNHLPNTHPSNPERIRAVAKELKSHLKAYAALQPNPLEAENQFALAVDQLKILAYGMEVPEVKAAVRKNGLSGDIRLLGMAKPAEAIPENKMAARTNSPFSGTFTGEWLDPNGNRMPLTLMLQYHNNTVSGQGFFKNTLRIQISNGKIDKNKLFFSWEIGDQYFGRGELEADAAGKKLSGTWGTKKGTGIRDSGRWVLIRKK